MIKLIDIPYEITEYISEEDRNKLMLEGKLSYRIDDNKVHHYWSMEEGEEMWKGVVPRKGVVPPDNP